MHGAPAAISRIKTGNALQQASDFHLHAERSSPVYVLATDATSYDSCKAMGGAVVVPPPVDTTEAGARREQYCLSSLRVRVVRCGPGPRCMGGHGGDASDYCGRRTRRMHTRKYVGNCFVHSR